jgi:hypothetical protein
VTPSATANPFGATVAFRSAVQINGVGRDVVGIAAGNVDTARGSIATDLVVADADAGAVRWLEGRGTGAFQLRGLSGLSGKPQDLALADLDGDGTLDVATFDRDTGTVFVAFGRGDGTFGSEVSAEVGGDLRAIVAADVFVAVADAASNRVVLLRVDPGPELAVVDSLPVGAEPNRLATGDFDTNGLADLVVANRGAGTVTVLRQGGGRVFSTFATVPVGPLVSAVALGDVNGDGLPDLLAAREPGELVVLRNDGRRAFTRVFAMPLGPDPIALRVVDDRSPGQVATGDGRADVLVLQRGSNDVAVLEGVGDGRFGLSSRLVVGADPVGFAVGNFDEDQSGAVDFATANHGSGSVSVVRGQGGGSFVAAVSFGTSLRPVAFAIADFDRDGWLDLVTVNQGDGTVSLLSGNGRGSLRPRKDFAGLANAAWVAAGDFDGDGFVDLALARPEDSRITILPNSVSGFGLARTVGVEEPVIALQARDLDFDGKADLLALQPGSRRVLVLRSAGATFDPPRSFDIPGIPTTMTLGEVVGDGNVDLLVGTADPAAVAVFAGLGGGEFAFVGSTTVPTAPSHLVVDDFIVDGFPDVAALSSGAGRLYLLRGDGTGAFTQATEEGVPPDTNGLASADLNGNGVADLVAAQSDQSTVTVWSGDGSGRFAQFPFAVGRGPVDVAVANLNVVSDATGGLPEVVTVNAEASSVTVLRNVSRATAPPATATPTVGPGTPLPPDTPTPLPTRTRRPPNSKGGSGGCTAVAPGSGPARQAGMCWLLVPIALLMRRRWR